MSQGMYQEEMAMEKQQQQQQMGGMYQEEMAMEMQEQQMRMEDQQVQMQRQQKTTVQRESKEQRVNFVSDDQETYFREREEDSQAPPDLEPVEVQQGFQLGGSMGQFGDEGYEPSADELIDVLKNLENLAAGNPSLYRSIVDQIKVANLSESGRDTPNYDKIPDVNGKISSLLATSVKNAKITRTRFRRIIIA